MREGELFLRFLSFVLKSLEFLFFVLTMKKVLFTEEIKNAFSNGSYQCSCGR